LTGRVTVGGRTAVIHQELNLMPSMTVAENIWIGREPPTRFGLVDHRALRRLTAGLLAGLKINIHPDERISDVTIAGRLCLLKSPFLLQLLLLRPTMDALLSDHVAASFLPPDPRNIEAFALIAPALKSSLYGTNWKCCSDAARGGRGSRRRTGGSARIRPGHRPLQGRIERQAMA
jgi:hypothetical protein